MPQPIKIKLNKISGSKRKVQSMTPKSIHNYTEREKEQALFDAAKTGNLEKISELLSLCDSEDTENLQRLLDSVTNSLTPLQIAAANGHVECVQMLINLGSNIDAKDEFGCTSLHLAAKSGNYMCLKALLEAGANCCAHIDTSVYGKPPYIRDLYAPHLKGIERGSTALHLAVKYNHVRCVEELLQFGADSVAVDINGYTSLHIAAKAGLEQCFLTLLRNSPRQARLCLSSLDTCDSLLHYAVENRMVECVKELVHLGCDVNHINKYGVSPLHLLLCRPKTDVDMEILKLLVLEGFNTDINKPTTKGESPLYLAIFRCSDVEVISFLIAYGADINLRNIYPSLLEYLLSVPFRRDILKCIMKCLPRLPRIHSLNVSFEFEGVGSFKSTFREYYEGAVGTYVLVIDCDVEVINSRLQELGWNDPDIPEPTYIRFPIQQPSLDEMYQQIIEKLQKLHDYYVANASDSFLHKLHRKYENHLLLIKKQLWYEKIASNPLTLQHCCRFSIRKSISPSNLKHIRTLPLPEKLLSYLLFECDE